MPRQPMSAPQSPVTGQLLPVSRGGRHVPRICYHGFLSRHGGGGGTLRGEGSEREREETSGKEENSGYEGYKWRRMAGGFMETES